MQILNSARDVCLSLHGLVSQARTANGNDMDHPSYNQVADYSKGVIMNITNFLKSVKMFEDESSRGTRAVESSIEAIAQEIHEFSSEHEPRLAEAAPEDVIRAITHATHKIVAVSSSGRQEDLLGAANLGRRAVTELLTTCKGVAWGCEDQLLRQQTLELCRTLAAQYQDLLASIVRGRDRSHSVEASQVIEQNALRLAALVESCDAGLVRRFRDSGEMECDPVIPQMSPPVSPHSMALPEVTSVSIMGPTLVVRSGSTLNPNAEEFTPKSPESQVTADHDSAPLLPTDPEPSSLNSDQTLESKRTSVNIVKLKNRKEFTKCRIWEDKTTEKLEYIKVESKKAELVVGEGGETIKSINQASGAHVEINRNTPPDAVEKSFIIRGSVEAVEKGRTMVLEKLGAIKVHVAYILLWIVIIITNHYRCLNVHLLLDLAARICWGAQMKLVKRQQEPSSKAVLDSKVELNRAREEQVRIIASS